MKLHTALALLLLQSLPALAADTFTINGKEIVVPVPEGYVRATDDMSAVMKIVRQMDDPMNDTLAYYISESDVPAALAGKVPSLKRTFLLKIDKKLRKTTVSKTDFSKMKSETKSYNKQIVQDAEKHIPELMKNMSQGLSEEFDIDFDMNVSKVIPFDPHYETEDSLAFSMLINFGVSAGGDKTEQVVAGTSTLLNTSGTVLFLYCYAPKDELKWTREASMKWTESITANNSQPPAKSPKRGIDWGSIVRNCLIGAVAGGLATFLTRKFKRKKG